MINEESIVLCTNRNESFSLIQQYHKNIRGHTFHHIYMNNTNDQISTAYISFYLWSQTTLFMISKNYLNNISTQPKTNDCELRACGADCARPADELGAGERPAYPTTPEAYGLLGLLFFNNSVRGQSNGK